MPSFDPKWYNTWQNQGSFKGSPVLIIDRAKGCFRVISTEILPKMTLSQVLEKYQIPFNFRMRVSHVLFTLCGLGLQSEWVATVLCLCYWFNPAFSLSAYEYFKVQRKSAQLTEPKTGHTFASHKVHQKVLCFVYSFNLPTSVARKTITKHMVYLI